MLLYSITINPRYENEREQRPRCNCFMIDFHKLFMVKINKMIKKTAGTSSLFVYRDYSSTFYFFDGKV